MMARIYNFSAGPAVLPLEALQEAQADLVDYKGSGMSIMEMSHRGKEYDAIHNEAIANAKELLGIGDDYSLLFIQGGASLQFAMIPMNFLGENQSADYINAGAWGAKAIKEAGLIGNVNVAADCQKDIPTRMPDLAECNWTDGAAYAHITTNETISGAQMKEIPKVEAPLIADMSSDILSRKLDYTQFDMFYAGAQKNLGPSGLAMVAIKNELAARGNIGLPSMLKYQSYIDANSLFNTPPCFGIYMLCLTTRLLKKKGMDAVFAENAEKAAMIYNTLDATDFYRGTAKTDCRSDMNITFRLPSEELEALFISQAAEAGMKQLKGHRSVGGIRASIYNAFPIDGVKCLVDFMKDFEQRNG
ncbi:MAG: 3-phosphoserine/phosphohydroxythreonine transaminase [Kiritimatiellae bacterium]|nr:3-phosphoserine/phosphohydroxythreonine transaminase [Kiritimatiellia bacterium]